MLKTKQVGEVVLGGQYSTNRPLQHLYLCKPAKSNKSTSYKLQKKISHLFSNHTKVISVSVRCFLKENLFPVGGKLVSSKIKSI